MQCQFCKKTLEDADSLQLHQVDSCPAILDASIISVSSEDESVEVVFKWLIDRVIAVPSVFLLGSNMVNNIELKKGVGCFKSDKVSVPPGKYSGQLVIDNDITPVNDFAITLLSEVVHLIVSKHSSGEESPRDVVSIDKHKDTSGKPLKDHVSSKTTGLSPLHQELLDHHITNEYDFGELHGGVKPFGSLLSEENMKLSPDGKFGSNSPDCSQISQLPRDSEGDDSFYSSLAVSPPFQTVDPDSTPSTPTNPLLYPNLSDMHLDNSERATLEPSLDYHISKELLEHEIEDAMRDADSLNNLLGNKDGSYSSVDYAGNPMSKYAQLSSERKDNQQRQDDIGDNVEKIVSADYAGNPVDREEMQRMKDLIENYKEVKIQLETKCESYDHEVERLNKKCVELEQAVHTSTKNKDDEKDLMISELKVNVASCESEMSRLNQEVTSLTHLSENAKSEVMELKKKCQVYEGEIKLLSEKDTAATKDEEVEQLSNLVLEYQNNQVDLEAKCESYNAEIQILSKKCSESEAMQQAVSNGDKGVSEKDKTISELKEKVKYLTSVNEESEKEVAMLKEMSEDYEKAKSKMEAKCEKYQAEVARLNEKCLDKESEKEVEMLKEMLEDYKNAKSQMETKCQKYEKEIKRLTDKCVELEKATSPRNKDSDKLKSYKAEIKRLDAELLRASETITSYRESKAELETRCASHENEMKLLQEKYAKLEQLKEESTALIESDLSKDRQISDLKVESESYESEMNRLNQELQRTSETLANYRENKVQLESKLESYENEMKLVQEKYTKLELLKESSPSIGESDMSRDRMISNLKVKADSFESEMDRLNQEVKRLTDLVEDYKNVKFALESKCELLEDEVESLKENKQSSDTIEGYKDVKSALESKCQLLEDEIKSLKVSYQNRANHKKTDDLVRKYRDLEKKFNDLQTSNQKLVEDYQGLEGSKIVYEEEVAAERERYKTRIKELEDKSRLLQPGNKDENSARSNINKLKGENKLLREKLHLIRNESEITDSAKTADTSSPRSGGYKPPVKPIKDYTTNYNSEVLRTENRINRDNIYNDDAALPSRFTIKSKSASPESYKSDARSAYSSIIDSNRDRDIENIMKRYSAAYRPPSAPLSVPRQSRSSTRHHSDLFSERKEETKRYSSANLRARSLDRLDSSGAEEHALSYKTKYQGIPSSVSAIPFCPTSVKDLAVGMKISLNRANGRLARGSIKWIGTLPRHSGDYVGVELEAAEGGKHDGNLNGVQYFRCKPDRGIFVKFPKVIMAWK